MKLGDCLSNIALIEDTAAKGELLYLAHQQLDF